MQVTTLGEDEDGGNGDNGNGSAEDLMSELSGSGSGADESGGISGSGEEGDDEDVIELVHVNEDFFYMAHVMRFMALLHSLVSLAMLVAYYHLKVLY